MPVEVYEISLDELSRLITLSTGVLWNKYSGYLVYQYHADVLDVDGHESMFTAIPEVVQNQHMGRTNMPNDFTAAEWLNYLASRGVIATGQYRIINE